MGTNCCKSEDKTIQTSKGEFNTKPYIQDSYDDIYQTRPPCWYDHDCPCPCHNGGQCTFRHLYIKSNAE